MLQAWVYFSVLQRTMETGVLDQRSLKIGIMLTVSFLSSPCMPQSLLAIEQCTVILPAPFCSNAETVSQITDFCLLLCAPETNGGRRLQSVASSINLARECMRKQPAVRPVRASFPEITRRCANPLLADENSVAHRVIRRESRQVLNTAAWNIDRFLKKFFHHRIQQ